MTTNIFLQATRLKLRFPSPIGDLTVEDMWDIPLTTTRTNRPSLENTGAVVLARQRELQGASILVDANPSPEKDKIDLQVAILREVATIRHAENKAKTEAAARASEKERLEALIREREGQELPLDKLKEKLAALG